MKEYEKAKGKKVHMLKVVTIQKGWPPNLADVFENE